MQSVGLIVKRAVNKQWSHHLCVHLDFISLSALYISFLKLNLQRANHADLKATTGHRANKGVLVFNHTVRSSMWSIKLLRKICQTNVLFIFTFSRYLIIPGLTNLHQLSENYHFVKLLLQCLSVQKIESKWMVQEWIKKIIWNMTEGTCR